MAKHARLSPSSSKRWMTCPGSVLVSEGLTDTASSFADEGTAAHYLGSTCLELNKDARMYIGHQIEVREDDDYNFAEFHGIDNPPDHPNAKVRSKFFVDEDMVAAVQIYLDYVRDVVASTGGTLFVEVSVPLGHMTYEAGARGTSDAVVIAGSEIIVIDLKYGMGVEVSAEENTQGLMYASGALAQFGPALDDIETVRIVISQPRVSPLPSEWACDMHYLRNFEREVSVAAETAMSMAEGTSTPSFNPSTDACRWCLAKPCAAMDKFVHEAVGADFDNLLIGPSPVSKVQGYDNALLSKRAMCVDLVDLWSKAVRAKVESELVLGHEVEGFKLVQGRKGNRAWSSEEEAEALLKKLKLKKEQMYTYKLVTPTAAEKLLGKDEAKWPKVQAIIKQAEGSPSVAPASDPRPAISVNKPEESDFDNIDLA